MSCCYFVDCNLPVAVLGLLGHACQGWFQTTQMIVEFAGVAQHQQMLVLVLLTDAAAAGTGCLLLRSHASLRCSLRRYTTEQIHSTQNVKGDPPWSKDRTTKTQIQSSTKCVNIRHHEPEHLEVQIAVQNGKMARRPVASCRRCLLAISKVGAPRFFPPVENGWQAGWLPLSPPLFFARLPLFGGFENSWSV